MDLKYRIINTTIKPVARNAKGDDIRKAMDRVGHPVKFKEGKNDIVLHAGQVRLVSEINPGVMSLQRAGYVKIEKVDDMSEALKDHVYNSETVKEPVTETPMVKAFEMRHEDYSHASELEGAVNPDGNPNFLVKAPKGNKKNATTSNSLKENGKSA